VNLNNYGKNLHIIVQETRKCSHEILTGFPSDATHFPDQNKCEQVPTARDWSGFFNNFAAAKAQLLLMGSSFSWPKQPMFSNVPIIRVMAANCALLSDISSSYKEKA